MYRLPVHSRLSQRGISLVEVLIGAAIILLMFGGILGGFQYAVTLMSNTRAESGALALANEYAEYLHALPYDSLGTVAGIPAGSIPQNQTIVLNGITYNRRVLIQYVDAPDDGTGAADTNGIMADYKRAKIELSWSIRGTSKSMSLVTNLVPRGIETTAGGGTLVVNVFDAAVAPVEGAAVRVVNASTSPAIDVTSYTNAAGSVMFPGAPASGGYKITVTKTGYSTDQTYSASSTNLSPNPPHVAVVLGSVSTMNFAIDTLSSLSFRMVEPPSETFTEDVFSDATQIQTATATTIVGGSVVLTGSAGAYSAIGSTMATSTGDTSLDSWVRAEWSHTVPSQTALTYKVYSVDATGVYSLIPDGVLSGNSVGFSSSPIDLSTVSATTYPRLALGATLESFDGVATPSIESWKLVYNVTDVPVPGVALTLSGTKFIGTDASAQPILKYQKSHTGGTNGEVHISNLEWDQYEVSINGGSTGYDISDACPSLPLSIAPGSVSTTTLVLVPHTTHSLRVYVKSLAGAPLSGATVRLTNGGFDETVDTSTCGHAFFDGLFSSTGYTVETSLSGYTTDTVSSFEVNGTTYLVVTLS